MYGVFRTYSVRYYLLVLCAERSRRLCMTCKLSDGTDRCRVHDEGTLSPSVIVRRSTALRASALLLRTSYLDIN